MRILHAIMAAVVSTGAQAATISETCKQDISQRSYTVAGHPIPLQHISGTVAYTLNFDEPSVTVISNNRTTIFRNGSGQHIVVDQDDMTIASTTAMPSSGPVTSQIIRFSKDGSRGSGERQMWLHGHLLQKADTKMVCTRDAIG